MKFKYNIKARQIGPISHVVMNCASFNMAHNSQNWSHGWNECNAWDFVVDLISLQTANLKFPQV